MKKRITLLICIIVVFAVVRVTPVQAACPPTSTGADTVTNPTSGGCLSTDDWDGQGGNDVMINNGTVADFNGGDGSNTLTNTSLGSANSIEGSANGTGNGTVNNSGHTGYITGNDHSDGNSTIYNSGTVTNYITGNFESTGSSTIYNSGSIGSIYGSEAGTSNSTVYNSGTVGSIYGNYSSGIGNGTVTNSGSVAGSIYGNSYSSTGNGTVTNSGSVGGSIYGNYSSDGNGTVTNSGSVTGNIYGNDTSSTGNSTVNIVGTAFVGGTIQSGNGTDFVNIDVNSTVVGIIDGQDGFDTLTFDTHNQADYDTFLAELATKDPSSDSITFQGHTYTWQNFEELQALLELLHLNVTWFSPNDERLDPHPAERIAVYCHADKNTVGVLLIDNNSQGSLGTSFKIDALHALGSTGTTYSFGANGVLSISLGADGHGYAAWNGGPSGANGQGDFAKSFSCHN